MKQSFADDIVVDRVAGLFLKLPHHMILTEEKSFGEMIDREIF